MAGEDAIDSALRALRYRERSSRELDERLRRQGFSDPERSDALETLSRTGLVDDVRFARARAASLAGRGAGDALIRHELEQAGIARGVVEDALEALEPELVRARAIVRARGAGPRTARYLSGKGFSGETVGEAVASERSDELR